MKQELQVRIPAISVKDYPVLVEQVGFAFMIADLKSRCLFEQLAIITDNNVETLVLDKLKEALDATDLNYKIYVFEAGEANKRLSVLEDLAEQMVKDGHNRKSMIMALGGGVVGDLGGFLAATYMRGIPFVQMPTTLLAMVDASIGGKTGVDLDSGKNLLGCFYQPKAVYINLDVLKTLPKEEFISGLAELIKHGFIADLDLLNDLNENRDAILKMDLEVLEQILIRAIKVKVKIVSEDEKEGHQRKYLNLGHTVGHAIEQASSYRFKHGNAVAVGMVIESLLAFKMGLLSIEDFNKVKNILSIFDLPISLEAKYDPEVIWALMQRDKKNLDGKVICSLLSKLGEEVVIKEIKKDLFISNWMEFNHNNA